MTHKNPTSKATQRRTLKRGVFTRLLGMHSLESPFRPEIRPPRPQFSLRMLLCTTTGLCVLFAVLGALGVAPLHALVGFVFVTALVLAQVALIEWLTRR